MDTKIILGILIPFLGTSLGAAMVFFLKDSISTNLQKILTGFAAGVMVAASFWSLLQPALEGSEHLGCVHTKESIIMAKRIKVAKIMSSLS